MQTQNRILFLLMASSVLAPGQWLGHRDAGAPRTEDGRVDLKAPTWKTADGKPDLSGVWQAAPDPEAMKIPGGGDINFSPRYMISIAGGLNPGQLPLQPWAAALFRTRGERFLKDQPTSSCKPLSTAQRDSWAIPFKIVQTPKLLLLLYEMDTVYRQVFLDGRKLPTDPQPSFLGYSVGRWEGETLVVETNGFHDNGWLDLMGHPHSDQLRMEERFRRGDSGHMDIKVTFNDPKAYTDPISFTQPHNLLPDTDLLEYFCTENEMDKVHLIDK
jgi:hypothetical protein